MPTFVEAQVFLRGLLWASLIIVMSLMGGCAKATVKFQSSDQNATPGHATRWSFDTDAIGGLSQGAEVFSGNWTVRAESDAPSQPNALCQTTTAEFPALALGKAVYSDLVMSAMFKPISGNTDRAAGLIFRIQDKDNYYILRANALENNVILFKYAGGQRSSIKEGSAKVVSGQWQELRIEATSNHFQGYLNGQLVIDATENTLKAGEIGLWTKADSVTCFDDVQATAQ